MDTRTKISRTCFSLSGQKIQLVTGHFDPLLPEHARRLQQLTRPNQLLIVVITNPPNPLLSQTARAELVAALNMVDHVVISQEADDAQITRQFIDDVLSKTCAS
jgi:glycerol-3-phosphate cytidylyltransferase-like family protein